MAIARPLSPSEASISSNVVPLQSSNPDPEFLFDTPSSVSSAAAEKENIEPDVAVLDTEGDEVFGIERRPDCCTTSEGRAPWRRLCADKPTMISVRRAVTRRSCESISNTGSHTRKLDTASLWPHTRKLVRLGRDGNSHNLGQLRTGMARLNGYLHRIGATDSDQCPRGNAKNTAKHVLSPPPPMMIPTDPEYSGRLRKLEATSPSILEGKDLRTPRNGLPI